MNIAASTSKQTILNSLLSEYSFGKIQSAINLNEEGLLAECRISGKKKDAGPFCGQMNFSFSPFRFDGTEAEEQSGQVLFTGKAFGGRPLLGIMQGGDKGEKARAVYSYSACVAQAMKDGVDLPSNGAGGVLYKQAKDKISLLFLPQKIFDFSARNASGSDCALLQNIWQDKNLSGPRALAFVRAVLIYQTLSNEFPFPAENLEARQADILDAKYLPLKNKVNGASQKLSEQLSYALEYGSSAFEAKLQESGLSQKNSGGEETKIEWLDKDFCLDELAKELGLSPDGSVHGVERKSPLSQKEFEEEAKKILGKKNARSKASRTIRRNRALFIIGVVLIAASLFFGHSVRRDKLSRPTTISLTALQSAEVFFSGLHSMDTILMQASSKGSQAQGIIDSVSNLYVASKMRDAFSQTVGTVSPETYVFREDLSDKWIYGITNFKLGENEQSLLDADNRKSAPALKERPTPLKAKDGEQKTIWASYYNVHNEGYQSDIQVQKTKGKVTLTFIKNRWLATSFDMASDEKIYSLEEFLEDRKNALKKTNGDAVEAAKLLKEKYEWIPSDKEMTAARIEYEIRMSQE